MPFPHHPATLTTCDRGLGLVRDVKTAATGKIIFCIRLAFQYWHSVRGSLHVFSTERWRVGLQRGWTEDLPFTLLSTRKCIYTLVPLYQEL
jgi:hypothetical protein